MVFLALYIVPFTGDRFLSGLCTLESYCPSALYFNALDIGNVTTFRQWECYNNVYVSLFAFAIENLI